MRDGIVWAGIALVSACAAPVYEGKYGYERGWRIARITHVGSAGTDFPPAYRDCRVELPADEVRGRTFSRVSFYGGRRVQTMISRAAPEYLPAPEDLVYVNQDDCLRDLEKVSGTTMPRGPPR